MREYFTVKDGILKRTKHKPNETAQTFLKDAVFQTSQKKVADAHHAIEASLFIDEPRLAELKEARLRIIKRDRSGDQSR